MYSKEFIPHQQFTDLLDDTSYDVGISIRRGEFLALFPESNQSLSDLSNWTGKEFEGKNVLIYSDDHTFRNELRSATGFEQDGIKLTALETWERGFVEFLSLSRCSVVYGTPKSSFAEEAALYVCK